MPNEVHIKVTVDDNTGPGIAKVIVEQKALQREVNKSSDSVRSAFQGIKMSGMTMAVALSPTLLPLAAGLSAGVGLVAASFGSAMIAAGGFGIMAKSVLSSASSDSDKLLTVATSRAQKLSVLQIQLGAATTAAQKKQIQSQIDAVKKASDLQTATIKAGWTKSYSAVVDSVSKVKATWKSTSREIASPVLLPWLDVVNRGIGFLAIAVKPVALEFEAWGKAVDKYFKSKAGSDNIKSMATSFGQFASLQLANIVQFLRDVGKGVFNLWHDLKGTGIYMGAFGDQLVKWGDAFAKWSSSKQARDDVGAFVKYLRQNGRLVVDFVSQLAQVMPGLFKGASAAGVLELQAITTFLTFVNSLPKSWQAPIVELAGAMLLLKKTGVITVGLRLAKMAGVGGLGGEAAKHGDTAAVAGGAGAAATEHMIGKVLGGGMKWAIRGGIAFGVAEIIVKPMLESASSGKDKNWWNNPFGAASPTARDASGWNSTRQALKNVTHWFDMTRHDIGHIWDMMWDNTAGRAIRGGHNVEATVNGVKHTIANQFDGVRHSIASSWDGAWDSVRNRAVSGAHNTAAQLDGFRHNAANNFDSARHAAASAWDKAWDAVTSRTAQGFHAVMNWIGALPGHIRDAFFGASHWLTFAGRETIQGLWNGMSVIWHKVTGWISGLAGWIKSHKGPLSFDRNLLVPAGKALMSGLHTGLLSGFRSGPFGFISGLAGTIGGLIANKFSGLFGGGGAGSGVQRWSPLVLQVLKMLHQSPSWLGLVLRRMNQESGGNPRAINLTDSNAAMGDPSRGLMQTIMGTFMAYAGPFRGLGIYNPLANIFAGLNYALHRYGSLAALGRPGGYAAGGIAGGWIMAGEHGRELIKIPRGSHVRSNPDTERMMDGGGRIHITIGLGQGYGDGKIMREIIRQLKIVVHDEGGSVQDTLGWRA